MSVTDMSTTNDRRGEEILLSLIYPTKTEDMSEEQRTEFAAAVAEQNAYGTSYGGAVKRESLGDASVTYDSPAGVSFGGQQICPAALARLMKCGLLTRWI